MQPIWMLETAKICEQYEKISWEMRSCKCRKKEIYEK